MELTAAVLEMEKTLARTGEYVSFAAAPAISQLVQCSSLQILPGGLVQC